MVGNRMNCLMKKSFVFAVVAVVLSACATKENPYTSELIPEKTPDGKVIIYATLPEFESADGTKAAVYPTSGLFDWQMEDKIDVVFSNGVDEETHTFECTNIATGAFSFDGDVTSGYSVVRAYYPSGYNGTPSVQHFASLADAAKGFQMEATVSGGKLQFEHENALFAITVKNLPLFAKTVWINDASVDVTSESGDVDVLLPVLPAASANLRIGVTDSAWNVSGNDLISKTSEKAASVDVKKLYNLTDLEIVPEVHFVSGRTGWDPVDGNKLSVDGSGNSLKERFVVLGGDEWFRFTAKYGTLEVKYGYDTGKDFNNSDPFVAGKDGSAHVTANGIYNVAFNFISGSYTVSKISDVSVYLIGIDGNWAFNNNPSCRLTNLYGNMWIWKGEPTSSIYKAYVGGNGNWDENTFGAANTERWTDSIASGDSGKDACTANDGTAIVTLDFGTDPWVISSERSTAADAKTVKMRHSLNGNDSWSTEMDIALTQHPTYPTIFWIETLDVTDEGEFKLYDNDGYWWGVKDARVVNMSEHPYAQLTSSSGINMTLPVGTYTIYYNFFARTIGVVAK